MKRIGVVAVIAVVAVVIVAVALSFLVDASRFKPALESELSQVLGRQVRLGDLKLSLLSGSVSAGDLSISEDPAFGPAPFLQAKSLDVGVELGPLIFSRQLNVTNLTIEEPQIDLVQAPSGVWNFSTIGRTSGSQPAKATTQNSSAPLDLSVKTIKIHNGRLLVGSAGSKRKPLELDSVDIDVKDFSAKSQFPFSIAAKVAGGGDIKLDGKAGPVSTVDATATVFELNLKIGSLDLAGSGVNSVAPDVTGVVSVDGTGASDGTTLRVKGQLKGEQLKFVKNGTAARTPVEVDFEDSHALRKNSGVISSTDARIGKSRISLTGNYQQRGDSIDLKLNLNGSGIAATDIASLLPSVGVVLPNGSSIQSGSLSIKLVAEGPADKLVTSGDLALTNTKLAGFNLGQKMTAIEKFAGIKTSPDMDIQTASMNVRVSPEGTSAQGIQFVIPEFGNLTGNGTISPSNALNFQMTATVHTASLSSSLGNSNLAVPILVEGSSSDPVFRPDMHALAKSEIKNVETKALGNVLNGILGGKKKP